MSISRRRASYIAPSADFSTQARVTLALSFLAVVMAGGVFSVVCYFGSLLLRGIQ